MFNFKELKLDKREDPENTSSFVGIRRTENNELGFRLPKGFENFPENDFNATKQLFFKMYRTFKKFENDKTRLPIDERPAGKDNIEKMGNAYRFKDKEDNEVLLYSKISVIENLLEAYRDLALDVIERRYGLDEKIDYSKIDQYLHKAVYLPEHVIYLDEMELPRHVLRYESTTIIDLFCFILTELETELEQESDERVKELSYRFKEQHLSHEQSLFNEETFETTISILKDVLDDIDKITAYKDEDYWRLYEAIESFLYGELDMENTHEEGIFWGISNFYQIWEDMCNTYAFSKFDVVYADSNIIFNGNPVANYTFGGQKIFKKESFENSFFIKFRDEQRWMRPDLIYFIGENDNIFDTDIRIQIKSEHNDRLDFDIKLLNKSKKKIYQSFCSNLKSAISRRTPYERVVGARAVGDNSFKNYPKSTLEDQKNFIENAYQKFNSFIAFKLLDWKYIGHEFFLEKSKKLDNDINKQICYEFCLNKSIQDETENTIIESQFVIPFFYKNTLLLEEDIGDDIEDTNLYNRLLDNKIKVFKANFQLIQDIYLNHD